MGSRKHRMNPDEWREWKLHQKQLRLFSRFDEGIKISDEMLYSITAEEIAHRIAKGAYDKGYRYVVDGCGGAGGNSIAFAENGFQVGHVELNPNTLEDAKHNAKLYGVTDWIKFANANILEFDVKKEFGFDPRETVFFASPEWGGPGYKDLKVFDLEHLNPSLSALLKYCNDQGFPEIIIYAPRTSDVRQAERMGCYKCEFMYLQGWCHAMCLHFKTGQPQDQAQDRDRDPDQAKE